MAKLNCWDFKKCGRQAGGARTAELGICPAAIDSRAHGINGGQFGGRACWAIAGTLCGGSVQGTFASKLTSCRACEFYARVRAEEGPAMVPAQAILDRLA